MADKIACCAYASFLYLVRVVEKEILKDVLSSCCQVEMELGSEDTLIQADSSQCS